MPQETMLLMIVLPPIDKVKRISAMMLKFNKGSQAEIEAKLKPMPFSSAPDTEGILDMVENGFGESIGMFPIHTIGCFYLES